MSVPSGKTRSIIVGTAGHVDHGKTALVYALTGTDTDRLPEEKQRGITIDLGFASLRLPEDAGGVPGGAIDLSLIDVPGHHAFVRNMLAGTGGIDAVMLVIAADEGVRAQTIEHLAICGLLGVRSGVIVLTKSDAVTRERLQEVRMQARELAAGTFLADAPVVAVSALGGEGMPELKAELARLAGSVPERSSDRVPRVPVDRVFSVRGFGTVATGTLQGGAVGVEDALTLQPSGRAVRVRGIQVHGKSRSTAEAPCRVALNLSGVEVNQMRRGDTLVPDDTLTAVSQMDVEIAHLEGAPALRHRSVVRVHAFASDTLARLLLYSSGSGDAGDGIFGGKTSEGRKFLARLQLEKPMLVTAGDLFVLRQCSPAMTIGGGRVLDAHPMPRLKKAAALQWLMAVKDASAQERLLLRVRRRGTDGASLQSLMQETGIKPEALHRLAQDLLGNGALVEAEAAASNVQAQHLFTAEALRVAVDAIRGEVLGAKEGTISRSELRSKMGSRVGSGLRLSDRVFALALTRLVKEKAVEVKGEMLSAPGRGETIAEPQRRKMEAVGKIYLAAGLAAPMPREVSAQLHLDLREMRGLITILQRAKTLVHVGAEDLYVHAEALDRLSAEMQRHRGESFDVGRFKSFTGLTRKHAIPLLEYLDRARVTRNNGGARLVL